MPAEKQSDRVIIGANGLPMNLGSIDVPNMMVPQEQVRHIRAFMREMPSGNKKGQSTDAGKPIVWNNGFFGLWAQVAKEVSENPEGYVTISRFRGHLKTDPAVGMKEVKYRPVLSAGFDIYVGGAHKLSVVLDQYIKQPGETHFHVTYIDPTSATGKKEVRLQDPEQVEQIVMAALKPPSKEVLRFSHADRPRMV